MTPLHCHNDLVQKLVLTVTVNIYEIKKCMYELNQKLLNQQMLNSREIYISSIYNARQKTVIKSF